MKDDENLTVVIPARNEERLVGACLRSVLRAIDGAGRPGTVVVVAHRCTDGTADLARRVLGDRGTVIVKTDGHVSQARAAGVREALARHATLDLNARWLLSTDADTTVPPDWVARLLSHADENTVAVAGLADLDSWAGLPEEARRRYEDIVAAGIVGDTHEHAYAANLAVRADAYLAVGGWPAVLHGEEHALLSALTRRGWGVRRPTDVVVTTSARRHARATGGVGDLLNRLSGPDAAAV